MGKKEIWKPLNYPGLENKYEASSFGNIRSYERKQNLQSNALRSGYKSIRVIADGKKVSLRFHQLIAKTFLKSTDVKQIVNHKDGNKLNNDVSNLEYCSYSDNTKHAIKNDIQKVFKRKVKQFKLNGDFIAEYESIMDAALQTETNAKSISRVCRNGRNKTNGFIWRYSEIDKNECMDVDLSKFKQINGFPNHYINKKGEIYGISRSKFLRQNINANGFKQVYLAYQSCGKTFLVHKLVAMHFIKNPNKKKFINHVDGDKLNNSKKNLEWF